MYDYKNLRFCPRCGHKLSDGFLFERDRKYCKKCDYILYHNAYPAVSAIIEKYQKILLVKRNEEPHKNWWSLPGGFVEYEESPEEAIVREVKEETGFEIKIKGLVGVYLFNKKVEANALGPTYCVEIVGGKTPKQIVVEWFYPDKLPDKFAFPDQEKVIKDWREKYGR